MLVYNPASHPAMKYLTLLLFAVCLLPTLATAAPARKKVSQKAPTLLSPRSNGVYSLHEAAATGNIAVLQQRLSESNTNPNQQDEWGNTALHIAAAAGRKEIIKKLLQAGASTSILNKENKTAAQCAAATVRTLFRRP